MVLESALHSAQAALFCVLAGLPVFIFWIRNTWDHRLLATACGLFLMAISAALPLWGLGGLVAPVCATAGMVALHSAVRLHRGLRPMRLLGTLILVGHVAILYFSSPGYAAREAASFLIWAAIALAAAAQLATPDEAHPLQRDPALFITFGGHALFCLIVASLHQLGMGGWVGTSSFVALTELAVFCVASSFLVTLSVLRADRDRLQREIEQSQIRPDLVAVCSSCRKVRDREDEWHAFENYFSARTSLRFTHGICPCCAEALYPGISTEALRQAPRRVATRSSTPPFPFPAREKTPASRELVRTE